MPSLLTLVLLGYINTPYKWGGQDYDGLDCSGLFVNAFRDMGIPIQDMSSKSFYPWSLSIGVKSSEPSQDCLLFFGSSIDNIEHISDAISSTHMIEAGGAGKNSLNMTRKELLKKDARVRVRPISNRRDLVACIKIDYTKLFNLLTAQ